MLLKIPPEGSHFYQELKKKKKKKEKVRIYKCTS
jgi:hypothetical protein